MRFNDVSIPEVYKSSQDFRFFLRWFELSLSQIQYDTENIFDLYDPLRCKTNLLWMLADTIGFKYDDKQYPAFNRLVLLYFMSMIRSRGSRDGMLTAGQVNLASKTILKKYNIDEHGEESWEDLTDTIYEDRLYSDVLPSNSVSVNSNPSEGYIDMVYFADSLPTDSCVEYVRPIGMYCIQTPGIRYDAKSKISIDARLVDDIDNIYPPGPTRVADYTQNDYSSLQGYDSGTLVSRNESYYRNSTFETTPEIDAGYRALYSLQLSNTISNMRSAFGGSNQANNLMGMYWVDTGITLSQLADEFNWNLPEPEMSVPDIPTENISNIELDFNPNMGTLGDTLS